MTSPPCAMADMLEEFDSDDDLSILPVEDRLSRALDCKEKGKNTHRHTRSRARTNTHTHPPHARTKTGNTEWKAGQADDAIGHWKMGASARARFKKKTH